MQPATFGKRPYATDDLLVALAQLTRKLGRFPTYRERDVARHADPEFPGNKAFRTLAATGPLDEQLRSWCENHHDFADVSSLLPEPNAASPSRSEIEKGVARGFVYLIRDGKRFKIGRTNSIGRRRAEAMTWLKDAKVIHHIETDDPEGVERYWHNRFAQKNTEREWFRLTPSDVSAFKRWKKIV